MSGPIHALKHEHRVIERVLRALDGVCARLVWGEQIPADILASLVDFIAGYAMIHHLKEEVLCFQPFNVTMGSEWSAGDNGAEHEIERQLTEKTAGNRGYRAGIRLFRYCFVEAAHRFGPPASAYRA